MIAGAQSKVPRPAQGGRGHSAPDLASDPAEIQKRIVDDLCRRIGNLGTAGEPRTAADPGRVGALLPAPGETTLREFSGRFVAVAPPAAPAFLQHLCVLPLGRRPV